MKLIRLLRGGTLRITDEERLALLALIDAATDQAAEPPELLRRNQLVIDKWPPPGRLGPWTPETIAALDPEVRWQGVAFTFYTTLVAGPVAAALRELEDDE